MEATLEQPTRLAQRAYAGSIVQAAPPADAPDALAVLSGYGVSYGTLIESVNRCFVPGCFSESLQDYGPNKNPLPMGFEHAMFAAFQPIGQWKSFEERRDGLWLYAGQISDTTLGRDASTLTRDGAINGLSIGFYPEIVQFADPNERVTFDTPFGTVSFTFPDYCMFVIKGELLECSLVATPADELGRVAAVQSSLARAHKALPGLQAEPTWPDTAYSMALLMGGRGAGSFTDLPSADRAAIYERLSAAYTKFSKTPPPYAEAPDYQHVAFQHDERSIFGDRYLQKTARTLVAGARGIDGALSAETREVAQQAVAELEQLLTRREPAGNLEQLLADLRQTTQTVKELTNGHH